MFNPAISVVLVSDYAAGNKNSWDQLRTCLAACASQDFQEPVEFILCEWIGFKESMPPDIQSILPALRCIFTEEQTSYELKNAGVAEAKAPIVAVLDVDCIPSQDWLSAIATAFKKYPDAAVVSGRSFYPPSLSRLDRILALLTRSVDEAGADGKTKHISTNNAAYRRDVYLRHPHTLKAGIWGSRLQSEAILRDGGKFYFEPKMQVVHDYEGWSMEWDIRKNIGRSLVVTRRIDPLQPYAWVVRLGYASIPIFVFGQTLMTWQRCLLYHQHYGVSWAELPLAFLLTFLTHLMEVPGIIAGFQDNDQGITKYR